MLLKENASSSAGVGVGVLACARLLQYNYTYCLLLLVLVFVATLLPAKFAQNFQRTATQFHQHQQEEPSRAVQPLWNLHLLDTKNKYPMATCLDGSPGAYYLRVGAETKNIFLHMEGGGWCDSIETCWKRSKTILGSTKNDTDKTLDSFANAKAYYSTNETINPAFWNWTVVYMRYCDGASFSGLREEPIQTTDDYDDDTAPIIFSRGNYILQATIDELLSSSSSSPSSPSQSPSSGILSSAEHLVVSGDSAGGLAVNLHAHQFAASIPETMQMVAMVDSGFFREYDINSSNSAKIVTTNTSRYLPDKHNNNSRRTRPRRSYTDVMRSVYEMSYAKHSLPPKCVEEYSYNNKTNNNKDDDDVDKKDDYGGNDDEVYKCMFAANTLPYMPVPVFILQSRYDSWQLKNELGYDNNTVTDTEVNRYGSALADELRTALTYQRRVVIKSKLSSRIFLSSCVFHTALGGWNDKKKDLNKIWTGASIDGTPMNLAMKIWLKRVLITSSTAGLDGSSNSNSNNININNNSNNYDGERGKSSGDWIAYNPFPCYECCLPPKIV